METMNPVKIKSVTEIKSLYGAFLDFKGMSISYAKKNANKLDVETLGCIYIISRLDKVHGALFMVYVLEYWNAYAMDIIEGKYNHVKLTEIVFNSWLEHMGKVGK